MWPFTSRRRRVAMEHRLAALETTVVAMANAVHPPQNSGGLAELGPIIQSILVAGLQREKLALEGRSAARLSSNRRPREVGTGRYVATRPGAGGPAQECKVCRSAGADVSLTAQEIMWHANGHSPGGPGAEKLPTYGKNGVGQ
jgi:hypothetical protein